ncbi:MAG: GNAT family N-acetyltransferase [Pseudomonadota bacterium]
MDALIAEGFSTELYKELENEIITFNAKEWKETKRHPIGMALREHTGKLIAGICGKTFGQWLLIDYLWVNESHRGKQMGSDLLLKLEALAKDRGCKIALLDTLDFQARPFYEKHGYHVQWTQENYPYVGCKYFMLKNLIDG